MAFKLFGKKKTVQRRKIKHLEARGKARKKVEKRISYKEDRLPRIDKLPDEKAYEIARKFRIPVVDTFFIKNQLDLEKAIKKIGFPCVMKVSGNILHKTEVGGVVTNIDNDSKAMETFNRLIKIKGAEKVILQKQLTGVEMIVGSKRDEQFGYVIVTGLGGIFVETLKDVSFRVCPISLQDAEDMVKELKGFEILKGARGAKPINFSSLYDALTKVSRLALSEKIKELDINPLFCNEHGCFAADIRVVK